MRPYPVEARLDERIRLAGTAGRDPGKPHERVTSGCIHPCARVSSAAVAGAIPRHVCDEPSGQRHSDRGVDQWAPVVVQVRRRVPQNRAPAVGWDHEQLRNRELASGPVRRALHFLILTPPVGRRVHGIVELAVRNAPRPRRPHGSLLGHPREPELAGGKGL